MRTRTEVARSLRLTIPIIAAWLADALAPYWARLAWWNDTALPTLPLVAVSNPPRDVTSSVPGLFMALLVGALSALCVEPSKVAVGDQHRRSGSLVLVAFQVLLVIDALRGHAPDWWVWMLSWFRLVDLASVDWHKPALPVASPWLALVGMIVTVTCLARFELGNGRARGNEEGRP